MAHDDNISSLIHEYVPVNFTVTKKTFALKLHNDAIFQDINPDAARDMLIVIEPAQSPKNGDLVVASIGNDEEIAIRQFIQENNKTTLKSIKSGMPNLDINEKNKLIGGVKQVLVTLD